MSEPQGAGETKEEAQFLAKATHIGWALAAVALVVGGYQIYERHINRNVDFEIGTKIAEQFTEQFNAQWAGTANKDTLRFSATVSRVNDTQGVALVFANSPTDPNFRQITWARCDIVYGSNTIWQCSRVQ